MIAELKLSDVQYAEVSEELTRILADPTFNASRRCVTLLSHLVDVTLKGDQDRVKERTLGIEVFGRNPNYDTNADPIVRRTAVEIRKRLAQYYQDPDVQHTARIRLIVGSYVPQFDFDSQTISPQNIDKKELPKLSSVHESEIELTEDGPTHIWSGLRRTWIWWASAALLVISAGFALSRAGFMRPTSYFVWKPLLSSGGDMIVSVSDLPPPTSTTLLENSATQNTPSLDDRPRMLSSDVNAAFQIDKQLAKYGGSVTLTTASSLKMREFANRPIVLIGGINYPLSLMILSKMRFSLSRDRTTGERWVQDARAPATRKWSFYRTPEEGKVDYGLITRYWDAETGGWVMVLSGLGPFGTEAAADLVTSPVSDKLLPASLRSAKNFQIVLKTTVVDGSDGPPQILDVYTW